MAPPQTSFQFIYFKFGQFAQPGFPPLKAGVACSFRVSGRNDPPDHDHLIIETLVYPLSYLAKKTLPAVKVVGVGGKRMVRYRPDGTVAVDLICFIYPAITAGPLY